MILREEILLNPTYQKLTIRIGDLLVEKEEVIGGGDFVSDSDQIVSLKTLEPNAPSYASNGGLTKIIDWC